MSSVIELLECSFAIFIVDKKVQMFITKDRFSFIRPITGFVSALNTKNIFDEFGKESDYLLFEDKNRRILRIPVCWG